MSSIKFGILVALGCGVIGLAAGYPVQAWQVALTAVLTAVANIAARRF